jgi:hypothetical protein
MFAPMNFAGATPFNDWFAPDTTQRHPLGLIVEAFDPYWGYGKFRYIKSNDALIKGSLTVVGTAPTRLEWLWLRWHLEPTGGFRLSAWRCTRPMRRLLLTPL